MDRKFKIDFHEFSFLVEACIPKDNLKEFKELEWKDIPNYEGFYVVSENGDVISLNRYIMRSNGYKQFIHSKLLEPITNKRGYLVLTLANEGKLKTLKVHQIVAMTFLNHLPNGMNKVVDHIDNNKLNNHKSNLQIITTPQNSRKELKGKTSKYHGVFWSNEKSKWRSAIIHKKKLIHLGYFNDEQEASDYYNAAVEKTENDDYDNIRIKKRKTYYS